MWSATRKVLGIVSKAALGWRPASWAGAMVAARGAHRLSDTEAQAAKRERRKQRRRTNRELRDRVGVDRCGWQFMRPPRDHRSHSPIRHAHARSARERDFTDKEAEEWELFQAVLGKPRSAAERRKFATAWKQWQAARSSTGESSSDSESESSSRASSRGDDSAWEDAWGWASPGGRGASSSSTRSNTTGGSSSSGSGGAWRGSAGASAGPRWGQANWSWSDFRQESEASSSGRGSGRQSAGFWGFGGLGDEEAWYEPPPGRGRGRHTAGRGDAWGWHSSSQQQGRSSWRHGGSAGWQHGGGGGTSGGSSSGGSTWSSIQLLGLERSWLSTRCGRLLKKAYLAKAKLLHPDVHAGSGASSAAAAEARFKEVQAAYEALLALVQPAR